MLRYLSLIICVCAVGQVVAYSRPAAPRSSPLAGNRVLLQPAATVEYLVPAPRAQYGPPAPSVAYGAPAPAPVLSSYGAPALAPVLNRVPSPVSYALPVPVPAPAPVLYAPPAPVPRYGAPAPGPRAPAVDSESIALAQLALSLPSAGGPIVDPIPIASSGPVNRY